MKYYNIHTHIFSDEWDEVCILNTYPSNYLENKKAHPKSYFSCGVHPWYAKEEIVYRNMLEDYVKENNVVAIGEAGFDKLKGGDINIQKKVFRYQVELSEMVGKPLLIHCVKGWDELLDMKKRIKPRQAWILHGYRGNIELTRQLLSKDFYFSMGMHYNKESLGIIPFDRFFCETDDSDNPIKEVYRTISQDLEINQSKLIDCVRTNIRKIFVLVSK